MPRIDPAQLLSCLQVLLSPVGGILSHEEVQRLASLMTKFSKKLVSKCVYVLILKNTEKRLLNLFMGCGGWTLIQLWLHDSMYSSNWVLVKELLELLILTPVDVERLKSNNIPKLVKSLSKREDLEGVCTLASQLVQQWLKIVKDETQCEQQKLNQAAEPSSASVQDSDDSIIKQSNDNKDEVTEPSISTKSFYKLSLKENKHALAKLQTGEAFHTNDNVGDVKMEQDVVSKHVEKEKVKDEKRHSHDKSKHKSSSSSSSKSKSLHKDRHSSSRSRDKSKDKDRHHSSSRDKHKDKQRNNGTASSSSSSSSSKSNKNSSSKKDTDKHELKEKQTEKDKTTLNQLQPPSINKLPKIPKKSADDKNKEAVSEPQKGSISIEVRKNTEDRPKTVKVYKSKMRSTGLEEEAKPAPPRSSKKTPHPLPPLTLPAPTPTVTPTKRSSPIRDIASGMPPEKKTKIEIASERPGAIKLIPPKPKPAVLQESDMFMDALTAATTKKEPKKRKRRASASKDSGVSSPPHSPSATSTTPLASPIGIKNIVPPKFYQDTLQTEEPKAPSVDAENEESNADKTTEAVEEAVRSTTPVDDGNDDKVESEVRVNSSGLRSVLVYTRRKGPKKSIKWKADSELVDVRYFELDESERVNVTRAFGDMAKMDVRGEREALQMSRKLQNDDVMEVQTVWKVPTEIDLPDALIVPGAKSFERDIQFAREKSVLQALYFNKRMVPDSPAEPDLENYQIKDPINIPVEDAENPEHDFRNTPWPESKGSPPRAPIQNNPPILFHNPQNNFPNVPMPQQNFSNLIPAMKSMGQQPLMQFSNQQLFVPPQQNMPGPDWNSRNIQSNILSNLQMMQQNIPQVQVPNINQLFIPQPEHFNPGMNEVNHRFPGPFNQQGPPAGMYPSNNNFNHRPRGGGGRGNNPYGGFNRGGGGGGGPGGGGGSWMRMNGPSQNSWHKNPRGHHRRGGGGGNYDNRGFGGNAEMY